MVCQEASLRSMAQDENDPCNLAKRRSVSNAEGSATAGDGLRSKRKKALLCGLFAINALLMIHGKPRIERHQVDEVNAAVADDESKIREDKLPLDTHLQMEGNYALDVIWATIKVYGELDLTKPDFSSDGAPVPGTYLLGDGSHWVVLHSLPRDKWARYDNGVAYPLTDIAGYVCAKAPAGIIMRVKPLVLQECPYPKITAAPAIPTLGNRMDVDVGFQGQNDLSPSNNENTRNITTVTCPQNQPVLPLQHFSSPPAVNEPSIKPHPPATTCPAPCCSIRPMAQPPADMPAQTLPGPVSIHPAPCRQ